MSNEIIRIKNETEVIFDELDLKYMGVKFLMQGEVLNIGNLIDMIYEYHDLRGEEVSEEEILLNAINAVSKDTLKEIREEFEDWTGQKYPTVESLIEDGLFLDLVDALESSLYFAEMNRLVIAIAEKNGFNVGRTGYENVRYVAHESIEESYLRDIWDGTNFYYIEVMDNNGKTIDNLGGVYIESIEELEEVIESNFAVDNYRLVKNYITEGMGIPLVEEIETRIYTYENID